LTPNVSVDGFPDVRIQGLNLAIPTELVVLPIRRENGQATMFTTNVRVEIPTTSTRVIPFAVAGGGVAAIRTRFTQIYPAPLIETLPRLVNETVPTRFTTIAPYEFSVDGYATKLALTLGGGVSWLVTPRLSADADFRYSYLGGIENLNMGRFGAGVSYRF
jgi:opacity protein-like surface antigen